MSSEFEIEEDKEFELTKFSKISFLVLVFLLSYIPILYDASSDSKFVLVIKLFICFAISYSVSWVIWFITGKRKKGGNLFFKLILSLIIVIEFMSARTLENEFDANNKVLHIENVEDYKFIKDNIYLLIFDDESFKSFKKILDNLTIKVSKTPRGEESLILTVFNTVLEKNKKENKRRNASLKRFNSLIDSNNLIVNNREKLNDYKLIVHDFIRESKVYKKRASEFIKNLESRLSSWNLNPENELFKVLRRTKDNEKFISIFSSFDKLMDEDVKFSLSVLELLNFLEKNSTSWEYKNKELIIDDDKLDAYHKVNESLKANYKNSSKALRKFRRSLKSE